MTIPPHAPSPNDQILLFSGATGTSASWPQDQLRDLQLTYAGCREVVSLVSGDHAVLLLRWGRSPTDSGESLIGGEQEFRAGVAGWREEFLAAAERAGLRPTTRVELEQDVSGGPDIRCYPVLADQHGNEPVHGGPCLLHDVTEGGTTPPG